MLPSTTHRQRSASRPRPEPHGSEAGASAPAPCRCQPWPAAGLYTFAGRSEPVTILGLEPHAEVRVLRADGSIGCVDQDRVRVVSAPLS
jgi:hypothetical protein